jgi:hypothetical protein
VSTPQWQTPVLTEIKVSHPQWLAAYWITDLNDPWNDTEFYNDVECIPQEDILAILPKTRAPMMPLAERHPEARQRGLWAKLSCYETPWYKLAKADRRALQDVYVQYCLDVLIGTKKRPDHRQSEINWLRWLAVREAHLVVEKKRKLEGSTKNAWKGEDGAYSVASKWLKGTLAARQPSAMKWSYDLVQRITKDCLLHPPLIGEWEPPPTKVATPLDVFLDYIQRKPG